MVKFERLDAAVAGVVADLDALRAKIDKLLMEAAETDAKTQADVDARAASLEEARGGSTGGI